MFQKGDTVLYGSHGVCVIEDISEQKFGDRSGNYYVLRPVYNEKTTIFVPAQNEMLAGKMRHILTEPEIRHLLHVLPQEPSNWLENTDARKEQYKKILSGNNRLEVIKLIRSLYIQQKQQTTRGKKLYSADEHMLKEAERLLYDEFAYVLRIDRDQVLPFILKELNIDEKETAKRYFTAR